MFVFKNYEVKLSSLLYFLCCVQQRHLQRWTAIILRHIQTLLTDTSISRVDDCQQREEGFRKRDY